MHKMAIKKYDCIDPASDKLSSIAITIFRLYRKKQEVEN